MKFKYDPDNLFLKTYNYDVWFKNEESNNNEEFADLSDMIALEDNEEV